MKIFNIEPSDLYFSLKCFEKAGCGNQYFEDTSYNGRILTLNNRKVLNFANCSYLGLETHPAIIEGSINAVKKYGSQNSMSRGLLSSPLYKETEAYFHEIFPGYPIIYGSTTLAHYSALPLLAKENDAIILDAYAHNSIRMASLVCKAMGTLIVMSKHNDMEYLRYLIKRLKKEGYKNIWYCADGIYSIHGNACKINELNKILDEENNFYAYIDDAHGIGWTGKNGMGYILSIQGLHPKMLLVGSLSKSLAASGGFIITKDKELADYLRISGHTFLFSIQMAPSALGALNASLKLHLTEEIIQYQNELLALINYFSKICEQLSLPILAKEQTPIFMIKVGNTNKILRVQEEMIGNGFFTSTAAYPAVNQNEGGLRISLTRHLKKDDIDQLIENVTHIIKRENAYSLENL